MTPRTRFISTAIPYANADPHIGFAFEAVLADALARSAKREGHSVFFLSGTDDNSLKNVQAAEAAGRRVEEFVSQRAGRFQELLQTLSVEVNDFIKTSSDPRHLRGAQKLWASCDPQDIEKRPYKGLYCVGCEEFKTEKDTVEGECPEHPGRALEAVEEENYFFRLDRYQEKLRELITAEALRITPESRKNEMIAFIDAGLEPFSISRSRERARGWGIPVPGDDSQIMYVWFDALSNYINALGYADNSDAFEQYWKNGDTLHVIGKGINRFHSLYWPAMLLSAHVPLPKEILVHGYITSGGQKMSKTLGNVIDPFALVREYGAEAVRYFLLRHVHPFEDSDFTVERFREAYNAHLANGLGNLVARVMKLAEDHIAHAPVFAFEPDASVTEAMRAYKCNEALDRIWQHIQSLDRAITERKPYQLIQTDPAAGQEEIRFLLRGLFQVGTLLAPFLPETSEKILAALKANRKPSNLFARKD